ncbi:MAG: radical SAM protein [Methylococcales bacterium]
MNLIVVDKCTNYCKYCFASNEMSKINAKTALRNENIPFVLDFIRNSGPNFELNIIGGEPFLYKQLPSLLEQVLELKNVSKICIFTGGIVASKVVDKISHFDTTRINFMFNMNEKKDYKTEREYDLVLQNFDLVLSYGFKAIFGYNIYEINFNYKEIIDLCCEYGTPILRWTIAFPELVKNQFTTTLLADEYKLVSNRVADFLEEAYQHGIKAGLDCPIPKCFFNNEQMGRIALTQSLTVNAIKSCGPVIDVTPDLDVFRCYALSDLKRTKLTDFKNFQEAIAFYEKNVDELYNTPHTFDYCNSCEFALNKTCYGGCISHSPKSVGTRVSKEDLLTEMFEYFQKNEFQNVEIFFSKNESVLKDNPIANYLMSYIAESKNEINVAKTFIRKSIMYSQSFENIETYKNRFILLLNRQQHE